MENLEFSLNDVFRAVVDRMQTEGAYDHDAYVNYIDDVLEEKIGNAELDPDANVKEYAEALETMWPQAEALLTKSSGEDGAYMVGDENEAEIPEPRPGQDDA